MTWKYQVSANNAWKYQTSANNAWKYQAATGVGDYFTLAVAYTSTQFGFDFKLPSTKTVTINWGDGNTTEWVGPFQSGIETGIRKTWGEGEFTMRAKAKDVYGLESDWATLKVSMPYEHQTLWELIIEWILQLFDITLP